MIKQSILLISTIFIICGCSHKRATTEHYATPVEVVEAISQSVPYKFTFVSQTSSNLDFTIEPRVNGYLIKKNYRSGMPVGKGDLLFEIDSKPFEIEASKAKANIAAALSTLKKAQSNFNRMNPLAKIKAVSQSDLDAARAELSSAREQLNVAKQIYKDAVLQLSYTKIYAPHKGIASSTSAVVGDYVGVGTNFQVLATVSYIDSIAVNLSLPMSKYLKIADRDSIYSPSYRNKDLLSDINLILSDGSVYPYKGIYNYTKSDVDSKADAILFQVLFPNHNYALKSGQFVKVVATIGKPVSVVTIAQSCVSQTQNIFSVWVVDSENRAEFRQITLGDTYGNDYIVTSGLKAGEKVITSGFFKLKNGEKITIKN